MEKKCKICTSKAKPCSGAGSALRKISGSGFETLVIGKPAKENEVHNRVAQFKYGFGLFD
jgi:hypothetical protein